MFTDMTIEEQRAIIIKYDMVYLDVPQYIWSGGSGEVIHMSNLSTEMLERNIKRVKRDIRKLYIYPQVIQEELTTLANNKIEELEVALINKKDYFSFIVL